MKRRRALSVEEKNIDTTTDIIDDIDFMVSQHEINLENFETIDENDQNVTSNEHETTKRSQVNSQAEGSSRRKSSKKAKIDEEVIVLKEGIDNVAKAIAKSTAELVKATTLPIPENEVWSLLVELNIDD